MPISDGTTLAGIAVALREAAASMSSMPRRRSSLLRPPISRLS